MFGIILRTPYVERRELTRGRKNLKKTKKMLDKMKNFAIINHVPAGVAHLVERHLAKVEVASSSLVTRSIKQSPKGGCFLLYSRQFNSPCQKAWAVFAFVRV